jgi:putative protease
MAVHNLSGAVLLRELGFTRVVLARELTFEEIKIITENCGIETEVFVHGAHCMSASGMCYLSSFIGGRSGNRGLCAQPCRLPYANAEGGAGDKYPLSLKDMSLAGHVREIIDSGVASLKIEGRMKSPEYVRGVTAIWRRLLDERRDATLDEMRELAELFSRGGFSDGYYIGAVGRKMLGVRSEENKQTSREVDKFTKISRKIPIGMQATLKDSANSRLTLRCHDTEVTVEGDVPQKAINAPIDNDTVKRCMSKLGDSCFCMKDIDVDLEDGLMMPISQLNALRRAGIAALEEACLSKDTV